MNSKKGCQKFDMATNNPRILLYCHNAVGIGHIARTGCIGKAIREISPSTDVLVITGSRQVYPGLIPNNIATVKLPAARLIYQDEEFHAIPQDLSIPFDELIKLRSEIISSVIDVFRPDIWVVDHNPAGFYHELDKSLALYKEKVHQGKLILGIRGIAYGLSDSQSYFEKYANYLVDYYDHLLIYTDPKIMKVNSLEKMPASVQSKVFYTGYISRTKSLLNPNIVQSNDNASKKIIVAVGSGGVGYPVLKCAVQALAIAKNPQWDVTIVGGLYLGDQEKSKIIEMVGNLPSECNVKYEQFLDDLPDQLSDTDLFIGRAGYNSLVDVISSNCSAIVIPYETVMGDQLLNAQNLSCFYDMTILREKDLSPENLYSAIKDRLSNKNKSATAIDITGAEKTAAFLVNLVKK